MAHRWVVSGLQRIGIESGRRGRGVDTRFHRTNAAGAPGFPNVIRTERGPDRSRRRLGRNVFLAEEGAIPRGPPLTIHAERRGPLSASLRRRDTTYENGGAALCQQRPRPLFIDRTAIDDRTHFLATASRTRRLCGAPRRSCDRRPEAATRTDPHPACSRNHESRCRCRTSRFRFRSASTQRGC